MVPPSTIVVFLIASVAEIVTIVWGVRRGVKVRVELTRRAASGNLSRDPADGSAPRCIPDTPRARLIRRMQDPDEP